MEHQVSSRVAMAAQLHRHDLPRFSLMAGQPLGTTKMWGLSGKNRCGPGKPEGIYVCIYIYTWLIVFTGTLGFITAQLRGCKAVLTWPRYIPLYSTLVFKWASHSCSIVQHLRRILGCDTFIHYDTLRMCVCVCVSMVLDCFGHGSGTGNGNSSVMYVSVCVCLLHNIYIQVQSKCKHT